MFCDLQECFFLKSGCKGTIIGKIFKIHFGGKPLNI